MLVYDMKLHALLKEASSEIQAINDITDTLVGVIYRVIITNLRQYHGLDQDVAMAPRVHASAVDPDWRKDEFASLFGDRKPRRFDGVMGDEEVEDFFGEMYRAITTMLTGRDGVAHKFAAEASAELELGTIGEILTKNNFNSSSTQGVYQAVKDVWVVLDNSSAHGGVYYPTPTAATAEKVKKHKTGSLHGEIRISLHSLIKRNRIGIKTIATRLAHELTHALDFHKRKGAPAGGSVDPFTSNMADYLKDPSEVNARYTELIRNLSMRVKRDSSILERMAFLRILKGLLSKYKLTSDVIGQQHNQIVKRALKHFDVT